MKNKTKAERTEIALKAVASRRRNAKKRANALTKRAKKAWITRRSKTPKVKSIGVSSFKSEKKFLVKDEVVKQLLKRESPKKGIVPSLPDDFNFELRLIKEKKLSGLEFHGHEFAYNPMQGIGRTHDKYNSQIKTLLDNPKLNARVFHVEKDLRERLEKTKISNSFAHIFADFCNSFESNKVAIACMLKNNLVQIGGLIWITVYTDRNIKDKSLRGDTDSKLYKLIEKFGGNRYKFEQLNGEDIYKYIGSDSGAGAPMYTVLLRRVK